MVIGGFMYYLLCLVVPSKNQAGQTGKMETGRKEFIV
jgi:hypothetical protein